MKRNTFGLTLLGTLGAIIFTVIYALILTTVARVTLSLGFGDRVCLALLDNTTTYIFIAFVVFEIIFFVWLFSTLAKEKEQTQSKMLGGRTIGEKPEKLRFTFTKPTKIAALIGAIALLIIIALNAGVYTEISEEGITKRVFVTTDEYTWNDTNRYFLTCDESATLKFTLQMDDGTSVELFASSNSCSDKFTEKYADILTFAGYISDTLDASEKNIRKEIVGLEYMEKYYSSDEEVWAKISRIIE